MECLEPTSRISSAKARSSVVIQTAHAMRGLVTSFKASMQDAASIVFDNRQASTLLDAQSMTATR